MHTGILAGAITCAFLIPLAASAQQAKPRPLIGGHGDNVTAFIAQHDDDASGNLTWAEFEAFRRTRFDATDENKNGTIDMEEYVREFAARRKQSLEQQHASQLAQTKTRFDALDKDKNGIIERNEFDASGEHVFEQGQKTLAALEDGSGTTLRARGRNTLAPTSHTAEGFLALYDADADGQVSRAEFNGKRDEQYARTDANHDGKLDGTEYMTEFEARLDDRMVELTKSPDVQTRVRFAAMDKDKDGAMTFAEYQVSGKRLFDSADRDKSGIVDAEDSKLPPTARPQNEPEASKAAADK